MDVSCTSRLKSRLQSHVFVLGSRGTRRRFHNWKYPLLQRHIWTSRDVAATLPRLTKPMASSRHASDSMWNAKSGVCLHHQGLNQARAVRPGERAERAWLDREDRRALWC
ncbi:hypothetical protein K469DRAFT_717116 [Zopfia rhizophila CBS 207.26]|uniref:Uncharacterized protein n=1 Tax=Zopfia rhizophila CBS 207.26 TaxID=1314779 RepID=A0A6A6ERM7_9PEZI|nr:hypothetical protein K469DRAFT_717116 [Zopfia rhizophila CBS 207.26]